MDLKQQRVEFPIRHSYQQLYKEVIQQVESSIVLERKESREEETIEVAREANKIAISARDEAREGNMFAREANELAREANTIARDEARSATRSARWAKIAAMAAIISIAITKQDAKSFISWLLKFIKPT